MRAIFYKLSALACLGLFFAACQPSSAPRIVSSGDRPPPAIRPVPPISSSGQPANLQELGWELQSGAKQKLSDLRGKVVVLDFWATYCPPCLEEIPHLVELQSKHRTQGLNVIGLNVGGDEDRPRIPGFVKKLNIKYDLGYPQDELVSFLFGDSTDIPQTFVFDRNGKLLRNFTGYSPLIKAGLDEAVEQALAN
jgi:thiol-disulfide isomerase/thioredoxin